MKKFTFLAIIAAFALIVAGCSAASQPVLSSGITHQDDSAKAIVGKVEGEIGALYRTKWFAFEIISITPKTVYGPYSSENGQSLIEVQIQETATFSEICPMGTFDFYIMHESFNEPIYPMAPFQDNMMPTKFYLSPGDTASYSMVYEVPKDFNGMTLNYTEVDENENVGATVSFEIA